MKNNLRMAIIFHALGVIFTCAATNFTQIEAPLVGGFQTTAATDEQVISAAKFAVKTQAKKQAAKIKLVSVSKAEQQVVAGMNYRLCLQIEVAQKGKKTVVPQTVQAIVSRSLKQKYKLTSWAIAACADETPPEMPGK